MIKPMILLSFDVETTGLDFDKDDIVEFSSSFYDGKDIMTTDEFINSDIDSTEAALSKHHLTHQKLEELSNGKSQIDSLKDVYEYFEFCSSTALLVGMNMQFDLTMMKQNFKRHLYEENNVDELFNDLACFDIYVIDKVLRKRTYGTNRKLSTLAEVYGAMTKPDHSAKNDAKCTLEIAINQIEQLDRQGIDCTCESLSKFCKEAYFETTKEYNEWLQSVGREKVIASWPLYHGY